MPTPHLPSTISTTSVHTSIHFPLGHFVWQTTNLEKKNKQLSFVHIKSTHCERSDKGLFFNDRHLQNHDHHHHQGHRTFQKSLVHQQKIEKSATKIIPQNGVVFVCLLFYSIKSKTIRRAVGMKTLEKLAKIRPHILNGRVTQEIFSDAFSSPNILYFTYKRVHTIVKFYIDFIVNEK